MKRKELTKVCAVVLSAVMIAGSSLPVLAEVNITEENSAGVQTAESEDILDAGEEFSSDDQSIAEGYAEETESEQELFSDSEETENRQEENFRDVTGDFSETGVTKVEGQLIQGSNKSSFVSGQSTDEIVKRRTMDGKSQTWRKITLEFAPDSIKMDKGNVSVRAALRFLTEDTDTPVEKQMTVGNCYYLNDGDTVCNSRYVSSTDTWEPTFGSTTVMHGETTENIRTEYYCIYKNNGKIIRYLIQILRKGCAGVETTPYYNENNPATVNWVLDEETGIYMADIRELDSSLERNKVRKFSDSGNPDGQLEWVYAISEDPSADIYRDQNYLYVKKAGQYNIFKASWAGKDYCLPVRFTYDIYERAPEALSLLKTDGVTDFSSMETADEFAALFPEENRKKARDYYTQVMALQKILDNTRTGKYKGDWDYSITGTAEKPKAWTNECESYKVDLLKEQASEVWENIFGLKDAEQKITEYTDPKKGAEENKEKLLQLRERYFQELENSYRKGMIQSLKDVQDILKGARKDASQYWKAEAIVTPTPKLTAILKTSFTSCTKTEEDKPFSLKVSTTCKAVISYKSSDKKVVTVDRKGKVTVKGPGRAVITVTGKASGKGVQTVRITVTVKPSGSLGVRTTAQKGCKLQISWKRNKKISGYQVVVATDKSFKKIVKTVNVNKNQTVKTTIKGLKAGKRYYVRVRGLKKTSSGKIYGSWNTIKTVKVKK